MNSQLTSGYFRFVEYTPGKLADVTVFSQDIMTIPEEKILKTKVDYTIIGGRIMYRKTDRRTAR